MKRKFELSSWSSEKSIREAAAEKIEECYVRIREYTGGKFATCKYDFTVNSKTAGQAFWHQNFINLNPDFLKAYPETMINRTIPHEIAHLMDFRGIAGKADPSNKWHGRTWRECCKILGMPEELITQFHDYDTTLIKIKKGGDAFTCGCPDRTFILSTREQSQNRYCRTCGKDLVRSVLEM